jgi:hypothetical protein
MPVTLNRPPDQVVKLGEHHCMPLNGSELSSSSLRVSIGQEYTAPG